MYSTGALYFLTQLVNYACAGVVISNMIKEVSYSSELRCCALRSRSNVVMLWAPGVVFESVICALVAWTALSTPRDATTRLAVVVYRDGLIFFLVLLCESGLLGFLFLLLTRNLGQLSASSIRFSQLLLRSH
ncbi:hypothetical protein V5O48_013272 [Marasmius crinis-equi]|uniref:Uncharacterized protein n=1 Tax=Marasmius crinis-equi TaxID=585013 RepID=A0ABR3F0K3_9AGAR